MVSWRIFSTTAGGVDLETAKAFQPVTTASAGPPDSATVGTSS